MTYPKFRSDLLFLPDEELCAQASCLIVMTRNDIFIYTWHKNYSSDLRSIFRVSAGSVIFTICPLNVPIHNDYLGFQVVQLVYVFCMIVGIYHHDYLEYIFCNLILKLYLLVTYPICPNSKNEPMILGFLPYKFLNGLVVLPVVAILFLTISHV